MRTLAIVMDGADSELVFDWAAEGSLPTLGALLERGMSARLSSHTYFDAEAIWPTIVTGCLPAKHGIYNWRCIQPGTNRRVRTPARAFRKPFWSALQADGSVRKLLVVDWRCASLMRDDNFTQVLGWSERGAPRRHSWPQGLLGELTEEYGSPYAHGMEREHAGRPFAGRRRLRALERMTAVRTRLLMRLMRERDWDLCLAAYFEPHSAGHAFHRYLVPGSWGYDRRRARRLGTALLEVYQAFDRGLAGLVEIAGDDANVLVLSGFGMRPNTNGLRVLDEVMVGLGYHVRRQATSGTRGLETLRRAGLRAVPRTIAHRLKDRLPEGTVDRHLERVWEESTDWGRTRAYAESEPGHSFVRINRMNVDDHDGLCDEIAAELRLLEDADAGRPAVKEVVRRDFVVEGPHSEALPDLMVVWTRDGMLRRVRHPRLGVIEEDLTELQRSEHTDEGFVVAAGPGIRPRSDVLSGHIVDLAPTLLHLMGAPIPEEMDGTPLEELLVPELGAPTRSSIDMSDDPWRER
jgi:predicted AlkP superfamily phosphohydrolase/phosphomutase